MKIRNLERHKGEGPCVLLTWSLIDFHYLVFNFLVVLDYEPKIISAHLLRAATNHSYMKVYPLF